MHHGTETEKKKLEKIIIRVGAIDPNPPCVHFYVTHLYKTCPIAVCSGLFLNSGPSIRLALESGGQVTDREREGEVERLEQLREQEVPAEHAEYKHAGARSLWMASWLAKAITGVLDEGMSRAANSKNRRTYHVHLIRLGHLSLSLNPVRSREQEEGDVQEQEDDDKDHVGAQRADQVHEGQDRYEKQKKGCAIRQWVNSTSGCDDRSSVEPTYQRTKGTRTCPPPTRAPPFRQ